MSNIKRWDIINWFIQKFGYRSYLEIGCRRNDCFNRVECEHKIGVDPREGGTHRFTSDYFFERLDSWNTKHQPRSMFDIVFIDGLHHATQVLRDVENSLRYLSLNGVILIHDCLPQTEESTRIVDADGNPIMSPPDGNPWHGDVWKAMVMLVDRNDLTCCTIREDHGIGVVINRTHSHLQHGVSVENLDWRYDYGRSENVLLNPLTWDSARDFARRTLRTTAAQ